MAARRSIDGTRIKEYLSCPRLPYLAFHTARDVELPPTPRMEVYFRTGARIERELLARFEPVDASFRPGDFEAGHHATLELIGQGVPAIGNGVLKLGTYLGRPDLLLRDSETGGYEVLDVKSNLVAKTSARLQIAFYSRLLAQVALPPRRGHVLLRDGRIESFELDEVRESLAVVLEVLERMRASPRHDPGALWREACLDCRYHDVCSEELAAKASVALVPGLTRAQLEALRAAGIDSLAALGALHPLQAAGEDAAPAAVGELSREQVKLLSRRALAASRGEPLRLRDARPEVEAARFGLVALDAPRVAPSHVAVAGYVFGREDSFRVRWLRAPEASDPGAALEELLRNLARSQGPLLVHGPEVERTLTAAADAYAIPFDADAFAKRAIDLRAEMRRCLALPGFDSTPLHAARSLGIAPRSAEDDAIDVAALAYVEGEPSAGSDTVVALLHRDARLLAALRDALVGAVP
jgi:CRISPR/Cas system-associated exonuclease Cas4 (RecB family)